MAKLRIPITPAVRFLRSKQVDFNVFTYAYSAHGGAVQAAEELKVPEQRVVKTLVMETDEGSRLLVLMHGDRTVSTRQLARVIGSKKILPILPEKTLSCTGYLVGGISPFGTRKAMPVYVQRTIFEYETIFINGGKRGFLIEIDPAVLLNTLDAIPVDVAIVER